jgi:hypothetical protein
VTISEPGEMLADVIVWLRSTGLNINQLEGENQ